MVVLVPELEVFLALLVKVPPLGIDFLAVRRVQSIGNIDDSVGQLNGLFVAGFHHFLFVHAAIRFQAH